MDKTNRYAFIRNLIEKNASGRLEAGQKDLEEEGRLALASDGDDSILDEEDKNSFVNPVLVEKMDSPRPQREREEDAILTKAEIQSLSKELGRPISFLGVKRSEEKEESLALPEGENVEELLKWAEEKANS